MSIRDKMRKSRSNLVKRHKQQIRNKDQSGRFPSVIMKDKLPAGVEVYRVFEGKHLIDILPWPAGPDMPFEGNMPVTEEGGFDYVLDIQVHQNIGAMKHQFVCPYQNFGEPCPICEFMNSNHLEKDQWSKIRTKRRVVYLIWAHSPREQERKGVQLLEISHFAMEEKIASISELPEGGGFEEYTDIDKGKSIAFERKGSGAKNTQYLGYRFIDRRGPIPDKILDQVFSVDQAIYMKPSYEEIEEAFNSQKKQLELSLGVSSDGDAGSNFDDGYNTGEDVPDFNMDEEKESQDKAKRTGKIKRKKVIRKR